MSWGYTQNNGPHTWSAHYPEAAGDSQSPIDIVPDEAVFDSDLSSHPIRISYLTEENFEIQNTGESFKVKITQKSEIFGGPLKDRFRLEQFHLHWGSGDDHGSEHTINGQNYAAELHLVHWNCVKYSSFSEAVDKNDGLAVLGVMIEGSHMFFHTFTFAGSRGSCLNTRPIGGVFKHLPRDQVGEEHKGFRMMTDSMGLVKKDGSQCRVAATFDPACLLPEDTANYWTYHGSLTTPPCCESVQWVVFETPIKFSHKQLDVLRSLKHCGDDKCIMDNYRPPLPVGNRKVRTTHPITSS